TFVENKIVVHRVGRNPNRYSAQARIDYSLEALVLLRRLARDSLPDVIDAPLFGGEPSIPLVAHVAPNVTTVFGLHLDSLRIGNASGSNRIFLSGLSFIEPSLLQLSDAVVVTTNAARARLIDSFGVKPQSVKVVPPSIDLRIFRRQTSDVRTKLSIDKEAFLLLGVGRLEMNKGFDILLHAIAMSVQKSPRVMALLIGRDTPNSLGGGSYASYLKTLAVSLGISQRIRYVESVPNNKMALYYSACDAFVLPSRNDDSPRVVLEAMACEKPVIVSKLPFTRELPHSATIYEVSVSSAEDLAEAIVDVTQQSRKEFPENRAAVEKEYSEATRIDKMLRVYSHLADSQSCGSKSSLSLRYQHNSRWRI
ncbi:MAG: glycosyltransferase family 4 protein, partial [Nitrososphaerota archaeon]|nr:glycosyltransferase family 4 protein [Nitrososphaerota archaeon]